MGFWKRFRTYMIGVGLGLILVMIFFGSRDWTSWTPQSRVLTAIDSSSWSISQKASCEMKCLEVDEIKLREILNEASVDFDESNVAKKPCPIYRLNARHEERDYLMIWKVCENDEEVELLLLEKVGQICPCDA